jgi:cephalosporin hydroxylase
MLDLVGGDGQVITIDIVDPPKPIGHERCTFLKGSSVDPQIVQQVRDAAVDRSPILVILDSDHNRDHVLAEMRAYAPLVTPGSYLIVEDTNLNGNPVMPDFGPGPMEAEEAFMAENQDFQVDRRCEKFLMTFNPSGYLRRRD